MGKEVDHKSQAQHLERIAFEAVALHLPYKTSYHRIRNPRIKEE
jgi:hypothetical protein